MKRSSSAAWQPSDLFLGTPGDDSLDGTTGRDHMFGNEGSDTLHGGVGRDTLVGGSGGDRLYGGRDNDVLRGGRGADTLYGGGGADTLYGERGRDYLWGAEGDDSVRGAGFLEGGVGNDTLVAEQGSSTLEGGTGHDLLMAEADSGAEGKNELYGDEGEDTLIGSHGRDKLSGGFGSDVIEGGDGDDFLLGGQGRDRLIGGDGDDTLVGSTDYDLAEGGAGNDVLVVDSGEYHHTLVGGDGIDTLRAMASGNSAIVYINDDPSLVKDFGGHEVTGFERVDLSLSGYGDSVIGGDHSTIYGSWGNDTLQGSILDGEWDSDSLTGTAGNDWISGDRGYLYVDTIYGAAGNDRISDIVGAGSGILSGGDGTDTLLLNWYTSQDVQIVNDPDAVQSVLGNTISGFELLFIYFGSGDDSAFGGELDTLSGAAGNDTLAGHILEGVDGDDLLTGLGDGFSMKGGAGADLFEFGEAAGSVLDYAQGVDKLAISRSIGDGDAAVEGAVRIGGPGGFAAEAELVIVTADIAGAIDSGSAAAAIGSASSAYVEGRTVLFVVDNGSESALYRFLSGGADAAVSAAELNLMANIEGVSDTQLTDYIFRPT